MLFCVDIFFITQYAPTEEETSKNLTPPPPNPRELAYLGLTIGQKKRGVKTKRASRIWKLKQNKLKYCPGGCASRMEDTKTLEREK